MDNSVQAVNCAGKYTDKTGFCGEATRRTPVRLRRTRRSLFSPDMPLHRRAIAPLRERLLTEELEKFRQWNSYCTAHDAEGMAYLALGKTVDLLLSGLKKTVRRERLTICLKRVKKGGKPWGTVSYT